MALEKKFVKEGIRNKDVEEFLMDIHAKAFIRGHDYNINGMIVYGKCLTIFSSRLYKNKGNGGILIAKIIGNIHSIADITIENFYDNEWKEYKAKYVF